VNIDWKLKSTAFHLIDTLSLHKTLYFLQRNATRRSRIDVSAGCRNWLIHRDNLAILVRPNVFEFGAGKSLAQNIFLSHDFRSQTVVDLFPMLNLDLLNDAAAKISKLYPSIAYHPIAELFELARFYGICYLAPFDAARTPFDDGAFNACISTDTLEHIPDEGIVAIFNELRRIIAPQGLISAVIDYSDHYAYTDRNIGPLNYLQYSSRQFAQFNHRIHYQNRLRHSDYVRLFRSLDLRIVKAEAVDMAPLPAQVSCEFDRNEASLCARKGIFLLQNP
jgi:Methyltransferase domain